MRKAIHGGETYKLYRSDARKVGIKALEDHGAFIMVLIKDVPRDGVCTNGSLVYTAKHKPLKAGHSKNRGICR